MPGLPSTVSETESPTGCTKQLISVTSRRPEPGGRADPAAGDEPRLERRRGTPAPRPPGRPRPRPAPAPPGGGSRAPSRRLEVALGPLGVLLAQHVEAHRLPAAASVGGRGEGLVGLVHGRYLPQRQDTISSDAAAPSQALRRLRLRRGPRRLAGRAPRRGARRRHAAVRLPRHPDAAAARGRARRRRLALLGDPRPRARAPAAARPRAAPRRRRHHPLRDPARPAVWCGRCRSRAAPSRAGATCGREDAPADLADSPDAAVPPSGSPSTSPRSECSDRCACAAALLLALAAGRRRLAGSTFDWDDLGTEFCRLTARRRPAGPPAADLRPARRRHRAPPRSPQMPPPRVLFQTYTNEVPVCQAVTRNAAIVEIRRGAPAARAGASTSSSSRRPTAPPASTTCCSPPAAATRCVPGSPPTPRRDSAGRYFATRRGTAGAAPAMALLAEDRPGRDEHRRDQRPDHEAVDAEHRQPAERRNQHHVVRASWCPCRPAPGAGCCRRGRSPARRRRSGRCPARSRRSPGSRAQPAPRSTAAPTAGSSDRNAISAAQSSAPWMPSAQKITPPSVPCMIATTMLPLTVARITVANLREQRSVVLRASGIASRMCERACAPSRSRKNSR